MFVGLGIYEIFKGGFWYYSLAASLLEKSDSSIPRESTKARGVKKVAAANTLAQRK